MLGPLPVREVLRAYAVSMPFARLGYYSGDMSGGVQKRCPDQSPGIMISRANVELEK